jgi:hypothetical protein
MSSHDNDVLSFLKKQSQLLAKFTFMDNEGLCRISVGQSAKVALPVI